MMRALQRPLVGPLLYLGLLAAAGSAGPEVARAQTLRGRVLEEGRNSPVAQASVSLLDRNGKLLTRTESDSLGRFVLTPQGGGDFILEVVRLGYLTTRSPLLALSDEGEVPVDLLIRPSPIGLEGFEVTVESEIVKELRLYGQSPAALGRRWIDRARIEEVPTALRAKDVIRWQGAAGVSVREFSGSPAQNPLCVTFRRATTIRAAHPPCAITLLNGVKIDPVEVNQMTPEEIEAIAVLTPIESTTIFGTVGGVGAVLIWTRRGGR
jgi:Carboxypeptidase regulatory-like domain